MFPYHAVDGKSVSRGADERGGSAAGLELPAPADGVEALDVTHRRLLLWLAVRKFGVAEDDAESLLQEVFLAYLQCGVAIHDVRGWLVGATCNASRSHLRWRGRHEALPPEALLPPAADDLTKIEHRLTVQNILRTLPAREREALRLKYFERHTYAEVALLLGTTEGYAEQLIAKTMRRLRARFGSAPPRPHR